MICPNLCGPHDVSKLIGSPPGYVGYEDNGGFIKEVRKKPYSVVLFDEIEKAHPDIINILLQILEDGRLTDNFGRVVSFKNTIIIMTSNIGGKLISSKKKLGFLSAETSEMEYESLKKEVMKEAKDNFRPEYLNRIDEIVVFQKLNNDELKQIVDIILEKVRKRLKNKNMEVEFDEKLNEYIVQNLKDDTFGARPIRRLVQSLIEDKIVDEFLEGNIYEDSKIKIFRDDEDISIRVL